MPTFQYKALDQERKVHQGLAHGSSVADAAVRLASQGLEVLEISAAAVAYDPLNEAPARTSSLQAESPQARPPMGSLEEDVRQEGPPTGRRSRLHTDVLGPILGGVPLKDLHFFFRQFATMIDAGVGMADALKTLSGNSSHPKLRRIVAECADHVIAGRPISVGLQRYPEVFSPLVMAVVRTGEESGSLGTQCSLLADYLERDLELRNLIRRETAYPKLVIVASMLIVIGANFAIGVLAPGSSGLWSPLTDPRVLTWVVPSIILIWLAIRYGKHNGGMNQLFGGMAIWIPYFGPMVQGFAMAKFGRAFGALFKAGLPFPRCLLLAADACGNEHLRGKMYPASRLLEQGSTITSAFESTRAFSPLVMDMIKTGEMTGNIEQMLTKMAEFYEAEGTLRARQGALVFGVACFLAVAVYVLFVLISFYSGYFGAISAAS